MPTLAQNHALRPMLVGDADDALRVVNDAMRPGANLSMAEDFPLLLGEGAEADRAVVVRDKQVVAHAGCRDIEFEWMDGRRLRLANIGAVATDRSARKRGHARALLEHLLSRARDRNCHAAVLWTDRAGLYEKIGFAWCGRERQVLFEKSRLEKDLGPGYEISLVQESDYEGMAEIRARDAFQVKRSRQTQQTIYTLPQSRTLVARHRGKVCAWVTVGKGLDFEGTVAEWGGAHRLLPAILHSHCVREGREALVVPGPSHDRGFLGLAGAVGSESRVGPVAMMKPLNETLLRQDFGRFADRHAPGAQTLEALVGSPEMGHGALPFYFWGLDSQ